MKKPPKRDPEILRVCTELGRGRITEAQIEDAICYQTDGYTEFDTGRITINPITNTVDTLVHECLHRLHPAWSERYVRIRTGRIMRSLSGDEVAAIFDEYELIKRKRKSPKVIDAD